MTVGSFSEINQHFLQQNKQNLSWKDPLLQNRQRIQYCAHSRFWFCDWPRLVSSQTPLTGLRHPSFGGSCRKAMHGMWFPHQRMLQAVFRPRILQVLFLNSSVQDWRVVLVLRHSLTGTSSYWPDTMNCGMTWQMSQVEWRHKLAALFVVCGMRECRCWCWSGLTG